ncbi:MAG TPA: hypothetical protein VLT45_11745 [Kofleriaceae bacterium]|nr:hypothetical protein [Kofleriaceae bacterium]
MTSWLAGWDAKWKVGWFGLDASSAPFSGYGPDGVATLGLTLATGFRVTYSWATDIIPHRDGTEQRIATLDRPKQTYDGAATLVGADPRISRARLARYAAQGAVFLLGLPHEGMTLLADTPGVTLTVSAADLAACDWATYGQRVITMTPDGSLASAGVLQSVGTGTLTLDVAPNSAGAHGGRVMPAMAVCLEPQQDFPRYAVTAEQWNIKARAAIFDFAPPSATLDLQVASGDATYAGCILVSRRPGLFGEYAITFANAGVTSLNEIGYSTTVNFQNGVTTLANVATLLDTSANVKLTGTYNPATVLHSGDSFGVLMDGLDAAGAMGAGAMLTMYAGHPVWDRGIENEGTITDSVQAQTELVDLGGVPVSIGHANYPSWGRTVGMESTQWSEWQWAKAMLAALRGMQCMFWLSTYRDDLTYVAMNGASIMKVSTTDGSDIAAWWPAQRDRIAVEQTNGTVQYAQILTVTDNGDGTQSLSLDTNIAGTPRRVSWLEPCRLNSDDVEVTFGGNGGWSFSFSLLARAYATSDPSIGEV